MSPISYKAFSIVKLTYGHRNLWELSPFVIILVLMALHGFLCDRLFEPELYKYLMTCFKFINSFVL